MLKNVIIPTLGLDIEEAVIEQWLKQEGERVARDEPLLLVETDKATTEINSPADGVLRQILHREGSTVPVTQTVALIETEQAGVGAQGPGNGENGDAGTRRRGDAGTSPHPSPLPRGEGTSALPLPLGEGRGEGRTSTLSSTQHPAFGTQDSSGEPLRASPAARRVARELGVDLAQVKGTGPRGRIQGEDVRRFAEESRGVASQPEPVAAVQAPPGPGPSVEAPLPGLPGRLVPLGRKRQVTAERMSLSSRTVARLTLNMEVDAAEMMRLRARLLPVYEARKGVKLSYDALLAKVVATALGDHPYLNARWMDQGIYLVETANVGVAVEVEDGLVVPVIREAHRKSLEEIAVELNGLLARARENRLRAEDMAGGSFTLTNLGMFGVDSFTPIVNPPEVAILGVGRISERVVGREGQMVLRPMMTLSLSFDHRVVDGAPAARFLQRVQQLLEEPYLLI